MKAGHTEEYVDGTSAAPCPQLDGVRPETSPALVDDRRSEDGEGRGGAKYNKPNAKSKKVFTLWGYLPFYQQGYYLFCFDFSQNFVKFR